MILIIRVHIEIHYTFEHLKRHFINKYNNMSINKNNMVSLVHNDVILKFQGVKHLVKYIIDNILFDKVSFK